MMSKSLILGCICGCTLIAASVLADDKKTSYDVSQLPPAAAKTGVTFDTDIKPMFEKSCFPCHGPKNPKPKGKLLLDTKANTLKGGEDGVCVVANNLGSSYLLADIAHLSDPDDFMPPPKNKAHIAQLTKEQVGLVRAWIEQGAK